MLYIDRNIYFHPKFSQEMEIGAVEPPQKVGSRKQVNLTRRNMKMNSLEVYLEILPRSLKTQCPQREVPCPLSSQLEAVELTAHNLL